MIGIIILNKHVLKNGKSNNDKNYRAIFVCQLTYTSSLSSWVNEENNSVNAILYKLNVTKSFCVYYKTYDFDIKLILFAIYVEKYFKTKNKIARDDEWINPKRYPKFDL